MKHGGYKLDSMIEPILTILLFISDRILKYTVLNSKKAYQFFSFFQYKGTYNSGLALSFFYNNKFVFYIVTVTFLLFLAWFITMLYYNRQIAGLYLVLFGGFSNVFDRFWYGAVIDYIELYTSTRSFPIFNIADMMIILGVTIAIFSLFKRDTRKLIG